MAVNKQELENVMEKVRKILEMTEGNGATPAEAANAAALAKRLMDDYELSIADIRAFSEQADAEGIASEEVTQHEMKLRSEAPVGTHWRGELIHTLCQFNYCRTLRLTRLEYNSKTARLNRTLLDQVHVIGKRRHIEFVEYLYATIVRQIMHMARVYFKTLSKEEKGTLSDRLLICSFAKGCVNTIWHRLEAQQRELENRSGGKALITISESALSDYISGKFAVSEGRHAKQQFSGDAFAVGLEAGKRINLNRPVESGKVPTSTRQITGK